MSPFDYINSITFDKKNLMVDEDTTKAYEPWMVNKGLSNFIDTVLYANDMNINHHLSKEAQYTYLLNIVRKKKRYGKWPKAERNDDIAMISEYYQCNRRTSEEYLRLMTDDDILDIKAKMSIGGKQ